ncbi:tRNA dimethylallyltransferase [Ruminococcaceae bacterium YRB3002]|nr:tRNA dimethylallyltransferase [Ruminococcaceae bacterium YRB3002]
MISVESYLKDYKRIPVIVGPTASGKSANAMAMCEQFNGELISCDSMQIYRGLDIGTAKPTHEEQLRVRHHLIDIIDPDGSYSVSDFQRDCYHAIDDVLSRGKLPVLCGGTGLYISAVVLGLELGDEDEDDTILNELTSEYEAEGIEPIYRRLCEVDPEAASKIHPNNTRRVLRAYSVYLKTGRTFTSKNNDSVRSGPVYPFVLFQPEWDRAELYDRINSRVDIMIEQGLVDEVRWLYDNYGGTGSTAFQAIGYKEIKPYLDHEISLDAAVTELKTNTRHYAKRQLTWFRRFPRVLMIPPESYRNIRVLEQYLI